MTGKRERFQPAQGSARYLRRDDRGRFTRLPFAARFERFTDVDPVAFGIGVLAGVLAVVLLLARTA